MTTSPRVSIVMLTHNREQFIGGAIRSVLAQEFTDFELLILDDGSTDSTTLVVQSFADPRIHYYHFAATGKISALRNTGIRLSRGGYIAFIDSDDTWQQDKLNEQMRLFAAYPNACFGFCDVVEVRNGAVIRNGLYENREGKEIFVGNIFQPLVENKYAIYPSSAIFKKECLSTVGWINEDLKPGETEFFTRLAYSHDCVLCYKKMVVICKHEGNSSDRLRTETVHEMLSSLNHLRELGRISGSVFRRMSQWYHYMGGIIYNEKKLYPQARREFIQTIRLNPLHLKAWVRILQTFFR